MKNQAPIAIIIKAMLPVVRIATILVAVEDGGWMKKENVETGNLVEKPFCRQDAGGTLSSLPIRKYIRNY